MTLDHRYRYSVMHRKIGLALDSTMLPVEWEETVDEDWQQDSSGTKMDREQFDWCPRPCP